MRRRRRRWRSDSECVDLGGGGGGMANSGIGGGGDRVGKDERIFKGARWKKKRLETTAIKIFVLMF